MTQLDVRPRSARSPRSTGPGTELDADGAPVWARTEGQELVPGVAAWRRLGVGLRCETWLGWSRRGWHPVVVKLARPHQVAHPRAWASLTREVYVLTRARHPNLPSLYGSQLDTARPYVVCEYVDGPDLADELDAGGPLDVVSAARLAAQVLSALTAVHATGAAHLDVKPENVLIRDGRPVLVDFGSARPIGSTQPVGHPVGTVGLRGARDGSLRTDRHGHGRVRRGRAARRGPGRWGHQPPPDPHRRHRRGRRTPQRRGSARPSVHPRGVERARGRPGADQLWPAFLHRTTSYWPVI